MRVNVARALLTKIASGESLDAADADTLEGLVSAGLVHEAPDRSAERAQLTELQARLRTAPTETERRPIRASILELSEALALSGKTASFRSVASGASYREASVETVRHYVLTARGRAFLDDLAPRAERVAELTVSELEDHMEALRRALEARGERAARLLTAIAAPSAASSPALRSAAIGLATCRDDDAVVVPTFRALLDALRARREPWSDEQAIAAAEGACLVTPSLRSVDAAAWAEGILDQRDALTRADVEPEQALHAIMLLAGVAEARRHEALTDARWLASETDGLPLAGGLLVAALGRAREAGLVDRLTRDAEALDAGGGRSIALQSVAIALAAGREGIPDRIRVHRGQLSRFSPSASLPVAALLSWVDAPYAETLDDLRLAGAIVQTHRLARDAAETSANGIKLLLLSAALAAGDEGDPEEKLALGARLLPATSGLGVGAISTLAPILVGATTAFVKPMLDAAAIWDQAQRASQGYAYGGPWHSHHHHG